MDYSPSPLRVCSGSFYCYLNFWIERCKTQIGSVLLVNRSIFGLLSAYFAMCVLSLFSSASPFKSISHLQK